MSSLILLFSLLVAGAGAIAVSAQPEALRMWMTVGELRFAITLTRQRRRPCVRCATPGDVGNERAQWQ